jgi:nucleotide-binding universal stress UspA family protein
MSILDERISDRESPEPVPSSARSSPSGFREVVVYVDQRPESAGAIEFAADLAFRHGSCLTGVYVQPDPVVSPSEMFARGQGMCDVIAAHQEQRAMVEGERRALFGDAGRRRGIATEWRSVAPFHNREWAVHARYGDVAVVTRQDVGAQQGPPGLVEALVVTSGRPTIVLPARHAGAGLRRILIGWNAHREAARAVADALPLLARAEAVEVLIVECKDDIERHGQEPGADVARYLARHDARIDVRRLQPGSGDPGHLLLTRAAAFGADLVVMGAYGHSQLSEWVFGGVTRTVLREAEIPVLMSR